MIIKLQKVETGFAQVSNVVLQDKKLSLKAKGLFAYLYSKPDNWDFSGDRMTFENKDGRDGVYSTLKELEKRKYLERVKQSDGKMIYYLKYNPDWYFK